METVVEQIGLSSSIGARWQAIKNQPTQTPKAQENDRDPRYIWQAAEDIPWHITELPGGFIERCRITPIFPSPVWERVDDVPDTMRIDLRSENGKVVEAKYEIQPGAIFNSITEKYGVWGVVELRALKGMPLDKFMGLNLDAIFTPWPKSRDSIDPKTNKPLDRCPKQYANLKQHIIGVIEGLRRDSSVNISGNRFQVDPESAFLMIHVGEDMLLSIQRSEAYDVALVDSEETGDKAAYTVHGLRALDRLGRRRRDHALNDMAAMENKVFGLLPDIIAAQQNQQPQVTDPALIASAIGEAIAKQFAPILAAFQPQPVATVPAVEQPPLVEEKPAPKPPQIPKIK